MSDTPEKSYRVWTPPKKVVEYTRLLQELREKVVTHDYLLDPGPSVIRILPEHITLGSDYVTPSGYLQIFIAHIPAIRIDYEEVFGPEGSDDQYKVLDFNVNILINGPFHGRRIEVVKIAIEIIDRMVERRNRLNACDLEKVPLAMHVIDTFMEGLESEKC